MRSHLLALVVVAATVVVVVAATVVVVVVVATVCVASTIGRTTGVWAERETAADVVVDAVTGEGTAVVKEPGW